MNILSLDDFIMSVRNGQEGPNIPSIRRNMRGDQVFELPFKTVCNGYCNKHDIRPLSLYTIMQQGICDDMTRRSQRSSLFRNLLDNVKNDWGYEDLYLPDIFTVKNVDFDESHMNNEAEYLETLKNNFDNFSTSLNDNNDEKFVYDNAVSMCSDIDDCLERNGNHLISLSNDTSSPYRNLWGDMSTLMKSDYLQSLQDSSDDSNVLRYATKKINKEIPDETPQMFTNLNLLEILKLKKIEEYKKKITSIIRELQEMKAGLDELLTTMPKPETEPSSSQSWLSYLMGDNITEDEDEDTDTDDEIDNAQKELQDAIQNMSYEPTENKDDDLEIEDEIMDTDNVDENEDEDEPMMELVTDTNNEDGDEFVLSLDKSKSNFNFF